MLRTRVLSALVLLPLVAGVVWLGGAWFALAMGVVALLAGHEFYRLLRQGGYAPSTGWGLALIAGLLASALWPWATEPLLAVALLLTLTWQLFQARSRAPVVDWALTVSGALYLGWLTRHFILLRAMSQGILWLALALLTTWVYDSGAYFVGTVLGRHRLWPRLSPRKTWEGAIGGWLCTLALTAAIAALLSLGWRHGLAIGALTGIVAPAGDLAESMLKRQVGAKDSGDLIPGHGGMLDRIDSLLFVVPVVYYYVLLMAR